MNDNTITKRRYS